MNRMLKNEILKVVENQLKNNDPPETKATFKRLIEGGYSEREAKELIGCVVITEIYDILKKEEPFNEERFVKRLSKLK